MDREVLEAMLREGLSQSEIGRRVGLHQSTVSYWCHRHGLQPSSQPRNRARGALDRDTLEVLVAENLTMRAIAERVDRSLATVRYWMARYELRTTDAARAARGRHAVPLIETCDVHGRSRHSRRADGSVFCRRCRADAVTAWRRRAKAQLVSEAGGACLLCGYARTVAALQFHHVDPATKRFALGGRGLARSIDALRQEAGKCVLLCANCHAEVETGAATLP